MITEENGRGVWRFRVKPKVFISYSWTSQEHQELIRSWAERLLADGVDVIMDIFDLNEGHDINAFIERMVTDESVTHVLIISDEEYKRKADGRKKGVGKESIIISQEVYSKVDQSKFIPIVFEFDEHGKAILPVFLESRKWIDFSSQANVNKNWEQLIRLLYNKPLYIKPKVGEPPFYILNEAQTPVNEIRAKFETLKQAIIEDKPNIQFARREFLNAIIEYIKGLCILDTHSEEKIADKVLAVFNQLVKARNQIIDWLLLELNNTKDERFDETLLEFLEELLKFKFHNPKQKIRNDNWLEGHSIFIYELFLYTIASLIETKQYILLGKILSHQYLLPVGERFGSKSFNSITVFYTNSGLLNDVLADEGKRLFSPTAEIVYRNADRDDISFNKVLQAELLIILFSAINRNVFWFPQTFYYLRHSTRDFPFFIKAARHNDFNNLALILDESDVKIIREKAADYFNGPRFQTLFSSDFWDYLNLNNLDTLP
jgi:hypothetical protein